MPEQAVESLDRFQDIADELTKSQEKLISNCFDMLETLDPNRVAGSYGDSFTGVVDRLQNLARKAVEVQMEMVKNWTGKKPTTGSSSWPIPTVWSSISSRHRQARRCVCRCRKAGFGSTGRTGETWRLSART